MYESDESQNSQALTDEAREYSQKLHDTLSNIEENLAVICEQDVNDEDCGEDDTAKDDVDLVELDTDFEVTVNPNQEVVNKKRSIRQSQKSFPKSPHLQLSDILETKKHTPQAFLKTAFQNLRSCERKDMCNKAASKNLSADKSKRNLSKPKMHTQDNHKRLSIHDTLTNLNKRHDNKTTKHQEDDICGMSTLDDDRDSNSIRQTRGGSRNKLASAPKSKTTTIAKNEQTVSKSGSRSRSASERLKKTAVLENKVQAVEEKDAAIRRVREEQHEGVGDRPWTASEIQRYEKARLELPPGESWFWQALATSVGTRTVHECQQYHFKDAPGTLKKKSRPRVQKEAVTEPSQITGGKGTLKRKRQIRELIENHEKDYSDDIFDSTPFRSSQQVSVPRLSASTMQSIAEDYRTPGPCKTPSNKRRKVGLTPSDIFETPHLRVKLPEPVSESKTPVATFLSPGIMDSVDRKDIEGYVHRLKKTNKGKQWNVLPSRSSKRKDTAQMQKKLPVDDVAVELFQPSTQPAVYDESDEGDYYFSDCDG